VSTLQSAVKISDFSLHWFVRWHTGLNP